MKELHVKGTFFVNAEPAHDEQKPSVFREKERAGAEMVRFACE